MNLFGKKKAAPKVTDSIHMLRETMTNLEKREKHLEKQAHSAQVEAKKKAKNKDKRGALFQLRRKKMFEKQMEQIYGKRVNLETQVMALEEAANTKDVFAAMRNANVTLKNVMNEQDIDRIDDVMEECNAQIGLVDEISEAMSQPLGATVDEDDLEEELAELDAEMMDEDLVELDAPIRVPAKQHRNPDVVLSDMPSAGTSKPISDETTEEREERELKELEALME